MPMNPGLLGFLIDWAPRQNKFLSFCIRVVEVIHIMNMFFQVVFAVLALLLVLFAAGLGAALVIEFFRRLWPKE